MKTLIIGAMVEEIDYLSKKFAFKKIDQINSNDLYKFNNIYLLNSGIGKVNAAISLSMFLNKYSVDNIISIGTSGSLNNDIEIGEIVNGTKLAYHDVDVTHFGHPVGKLPHNDLYFKTSNSNFFKEVLDEYKNKVKIHDGLIVTGDQFSDAKKKDFIKKNFDNPLAIEMESTAMVHTANAYGVDINVLRVVSDKAGEEAPEEFSKFLNKVCLKYEDLINIIIEK